jgi:hypothetical protein
MRVKNVLITILVVGLAAYGGLKAYMYYRAKEDIDIFFAPIRLMLPVEYSYISTSIYGPVSIKDIKIRIPQIEEEINLGDFTLLERNYSGDLVKGNVPVRLHFKFDDLLLNVSLIEKYLEFIHKIARHNNVQLNFTPELVQRLGFARVYNESMNLRQLGYDQLVVDGEFDFKLDRVANKAHLMWRIAIEGMGDISVETDLDGLSQNINSAVLGVKIVESKITYIDDSYVERMIKMFAEFNGVKPEQQKKAMFSVLDKDLAEHNVKLSPDSVKNLKAFLTSPKQLILTMYPYRPVGIESIKHYKPGDVPMLLNLQIYTE